MMADKTAGGLVGLTAALTDSWKAVLRVASWALQKAELMVA